MGLGVVPPPEGEKTRLNLELACQNIDLLELMYEKTRGNRTQEEDRLIEQLLFELRMRFVEKKKETLK